MAYTVYRVTNLITRDFYIGVHKTNNPHDTYLGSGKAIRAQVALHGPENFTKEILFIFEKKREAYRKEAELVDPLVGTPKCLNLHPGGHGGFGYLNRPGGAGDVGRQRALTRRSYVQATRRRQELAALDPVFARRLHDQRLKNLQTARDNSNALDNLKLGTKAWTGSHHTDATRAQMSEKKRGAANGAYGSVWVCDPSSKEARRVTPAEAASLLQSGWVRGRTSRM